MPPSEGICNGYTRRTMNATFATYRFLQPISRSSTIFLAPLPDIPFEERAIFIWKRPRERERERRGRGRKFVCPSHGCAREENEVRFFPPLAEETRRNVVPTLSPRNLREPGFVNRTVFRDGRRGEEDEERRGDRRSAIEAEQRYRLIGGGGRLA